MKTFDIIVLFLAGVMLLLLIALIFSGLVMLLWNGCLVPAVNGVNEISWLQAFGITILFNILFKPTSVKVPK